VYRIWIFKR